MAKQQINFRASDLTARQLEWLAGRWGTTQSETVTICLDRIYRQEQTTMRDEILTGRAQPDTSYPTTGQTFYYHNDNEPLEDIGRVPGQTGMHVLRRPDGRLMTAGGYHLRREGEIWPDIPDDIDYHGHGMPRQ